MSTPPTAQNREPENTAGQDRLEPSVVPCLVTLHSEQAATLRVLAPEGSSEAVLRELALRELDASGGAEWVSREGGVESVEWCPDGS